MSKGALYRNNVWSESQRIELMEECTDDVKEGRNQFLRQMREHRL
jgi:hypothetical protein